MEDLRAEHLAVVVHEREHDGAVVVEEVAEFEVAAGFVFESVGEGERAVEVLIDAGVFLPGGSLLGGGANGAVGGVLRVRGDDEGAEGDGEDEGVGAGTEHTSEYAARIAENTEVTETRVLRGERVGPVEESTGHLRTISQWLKLGSSGGFLRQGRRAVAKGNVTELEPCFSKMVKDGTFGVNTGSRGIDDRMAEDSAPCCGVNLADPEFWGFGVRVGVRGWACSRCAARSSA